MEAFARPVVLLRNKKHVGFLLICFWNGADWEYHTKETMPGDVTLPDKDEVPYVVTREEPSSAHKSLGVTVTLTEDQSA